MGVPAASGDRIPGRSRGSALTGRIAESTELGASERARQSAEWRWRRATSRWRRLPDFVIIGGQRCGTTSLFHSLAEHPRLQPSFRKEVHYFDFHRVREDVNWYRANFAMKTSRSSLSFEATPNYLAYPEGPEAMAQTLPDAKLIALLRNPVERAHSSWKFATYRGFEDRPFEEAVKSPEAADTGGSSERHRGAHDLRSGYLVKGRYAEHLERWFEHYPREQILAIRSEALFDDPGTTMPQVLEFIDPSLDRDFPMMHIHATPPADIDPGVREWLTEYYEPFNRRLEALLGLEFDWS